MARSDYAFPFRVDQAAGQAARIDYPTHVRQMIQQLLLTTPGERIDLPEFGCGLRRALFAPNADFATAGPGPSLDPMQATLQIIVREAVARWLAGQVVAQEVTVNRDPVNGTVLIELTYQLVETRSTELLELTIAQ